MTTHPFLEKLLDGQAVEWKPLGEVGELKRGKRVVKKELASEGFPVYQNSLTPLGYFDKFNCLAENPFIISAGAAGDIGYSEVDFWAADDCWYFIKLEKLSPKYLYYFLKTKQYTIYSKVRKASIPRLSRAAIEKLEIPIPPLSVQKEIANILDLFSKMWYELANELALRLSQYNYYRDKLLTFDDGVKWKCLEDTGEIIRGNGLQKKDFTKTGVPAIHYGQIYTKFGLCANKSFSFVSEDLAKKLRVAQTNDLLIATTSENDEDVVKSLAWLGGKAVISGDMMLFRHNENVKYLAYYFQTADFQSQKKKYITGTKVRRVSKDNLAKIKIPIPPLEEQQRIVDILDQFDTLTTSITEGLPKEIELRQKQYEYYRDLLLNFPRGETK